MWIALILLSVDTYQTINYGVIMALGRQKCAAYLTFLSNDVIGIPLVYVFSFIIGNHINSDSK